jgi:hypothetical protein
MNEIYLQTRAVRRAADYAPSPSQKEMLEQAEKDSALFQEHDHMPREVASELLRCAGRQTARQRKTYLAALERRYLPQASPKPGEYKMAARFNAAELKQLANWLRRAINLKKHCERKLKSPRITGHKEAEALLALYGQRLNLAEAIAEEIAVVLKSRNVRI